MAGYTYHRNARLPKTKSPQVTYPPNYWDLPTKALPTPGLTPAPTGMNRLPPTPAAAGPSPMDRLLGDQYVYPSQTGRAVPTAQAPGMPVGGSGLSRLMGGAPPRGDTSAIPPGHRLFGLSPEAQRQMVAAMEQRANSPVPTSLQFAQQNGYEFPQQPSQNPMQTRPTAWERVTSGMSPDLQYSAPGRGDPLNKLLPARNREEILAGTNMRGLGQTQTLQQAADDPNFNADGRFFQGAKLGVNPNGSAYFREGPRPTDFAGNAQNADQANYNRLSSLQKLEARGVGSIDPVTGAFVGEKSKVNGFPNQIAGRLAAGGNTPTTLTEQQLNDNRMAMLNRLLGKRQQAMERVREYAALDTAERRARMNPSPMDKLLGNNPQMAAMLLQQQGRERLAQLENQGRIGAAAAENQWRQGAINQQGFNAAIAAGMDPNEAAQRFGVGGLPNQQGQQAAGNIPAPGSAQYNKLAEAAKTLPDDDRLAEYLASQGIPGIAIPDMVARLRGRKTSVDRVQQMGRWASFLGQLTGGMSGLRDWMEGINSGEPIPGPVVPGS